MNGMSKTACRAGCRGPCGTSANACRASSSTARSLRRASSSSRSCSAHRQLQNPTLAHLPSAGTEGAVWCCFHRDRERAPVGYAKKIYFFKSERFPTFHPSQQIPISSFTFSPLCSSHFLPLSPFESCNKHILYYM